MTKLRMTGILVMETIIPFALFILLGLVRYNEPISPQGMDIWSAHPLPSAGLATVVQSLLCDFKGSDENGYFPMSNNSSYYQMLDKIDSIYRMIDKIHDNSFDSQHNNLLNDLYYISKQMPQDGSCSSSNNGNQYGNKTE